MYELFYWFFSNLKNNIKTMLALASGTEKDNVHKQKLETKKSNCYKFTSDIAETNFTMTSRWKILIYSTLYAFQNPRCNV